MALSKSALACRIMSRGLRLKFQFIGMVNQQSQLKEHSKKRWKLDSSHPEWQSTQLYSHPVPYSFFSKGSLYIYPLEATRRKTYVFQDYLRPRAIWVEEKLQWPQLGYCRPSCYCTLINPMSSSRCLSHYHPNFYPVRGSQQPVTNLQLEWTMAG